MKQLNGFFEEAILVTKDFEPIFRTGIYDMMFLPDEEEVMEYIADFIDTLERINVLELGDFAGYIYEELIPDEERHQLGQFYTPPAITELITRWAIRSQEDVILDPGVGSGTFLLWAYKVLLKLKTGRDELPAPRDVHEKILNQLYAIDINPFPAHLTTMNLAMRNVRAPFENMNVIVDDFFRVRPGETYLLRVKTPKGEEVRSVSLPKSFNAVVGNPPYTRWVEIPEPTQNLILDPNDELRDEISKYGLTPQVRRGIEPGIYIYWIMHAAKFLKNGGRLGMIISNMWLQTDYGVKFGNFLLDNFKIEAVIDFSARLFRIPLIATCVILLEKCEDEEERKKNEAIFMFIDKEAKVDEILEALQEPEKFTNKFLINVVKQENIPRDDKWISLLFNPDEILDLLIKNPLMVKMSELFEPSRGNTTFSMWAIRHGRRPDLGAKDFFYFNESKAKEYGIGDDFLEPAITGARQVKYFTFTEKDWKTLRTGDKNCYLFICHKPREELPDSVKKYIELGEPICPICGKKFKEPKIDSEGFFTCVNGHRISGSEKIITLIPKTRGGGTIASEAIACKTREKEKKYFYGWYDLGGFKYAPIMAIYQSQYKTRFFYCKHPVATYHAIITFIPKVDLNETQIKALLAYLNSSFTQLYVEKNARTTGGGIAALEVDYAQSIPVIDVRELDDTYLNKLASLFDKLEKEARRLGDAAKKENVEKLWDSIILEIDNVVEEILKLPSGVGSIAKNIAMEMMERRVARTKGARPEAVKGEETPVVKPKKKKSRKKKKEASTPLNKWMK
jgi:type I restriction-modification system DNA methylase subunit